MTTKTKSSDGGIAAKQKVPSGLRVRTAVKAGYLKIRLEDVLVSSYQ